MNKMIIIYYTFLTVSKADLDFLLNLSQTEGPKVPSFPKGG